MTYGGSIALIVIGATCLGFFIRVFAAMFQYGLHRLQSDPESNQKFSQLWKFLSFSKR